MEWFCKHASGAYAVSIVGENDKAHGELLTKQRVLGEVSWEGCVHNPFTGNAAELSAEIERRVAFRKMKGTL